MNPICIVGVVLCCITFLKAEIKNVDLNNGLKMPVVGYGTFDANGEELENALDAALEAGYRHIDTASLHQNEEVIGRVLKRWISSGKLTRDDLFLVTKLPSIGMRPEHVQKFLKESLQKLQVDYLDLYLLHGPIGFKYRENKLLPITPDGDIELDLTTNLTAVWKTMEEQVDLGLTKGIGISNFNQSQTERILNVARIPPATNQVEFHIYFQPNDIVKFCQDRNIVVTGYSPFGSPGLRFIKKGEAPSGDLNDPAVLQLAKKYNKSPAQILLRHGLQRGLVVVPKSTTVSRIQENIEIFDFELDDKEMDLLNGLDKGVSGKIPFTTIRGIHSHPEAGYFW